MITSLANEKIKHARALVHLHKARERHQQFVIEGVRLTLEAERAGIVPALLFCSDEFARSTAGQRLAQRWPSAITLVSDQALAALSDTVTPQGVVAVVPQPRLTAARRDLVLIVDGVRDPGNLGTLLRSALAAGVDEVLLSIGCADSYSPKVVRAAMGAHFHLPMHGDLDWRAIGESVAELDVLLADAAGETDYAQWDWRKPSALLVGGEAAGASADGRALATQRVRIPMRDASESLNAAVAGSVILFEAARQRRM